VLLSKFDRYGQHHVFRNELRFRMVTENDTICKQ
jgi:hypothetical protein